MCIVIDLDVVCLICLQLDKQMHCIFQSDEECPDDIEFAQKISMLSELKIDQNNESLPNKICNSCLNDLKAAWRFHKNCQAAKIIFETIVRRNKSPELEQLRECEDLATKELAVQKIKVPQGLQIKRIQHDKPDEAGVSKKSPKTQNVLQYEIDTDKDGSTLLEEFRSDESVKGVHEYDDEEFQNIPDGGEEEEDDEDEVALIEYYLADDAGAEDQLQPIINVIPSALHKKLQKIKVEEKLKPNKDSTIKVALEPEQTRSSGRSQQQELPKSSNQQSRPKILKQTTITQSKQKILKSNVQMPSAAASDRSLQSKRDSRITEPREVRTRKRKSLSPDTKPPKICEICGNSYRFQHALNAHMRRHYNDKPFPCEFCDKAFVSNVELRRHMRVHTGAKPYACQYCERRFSDYGSRIKHERTHTGERPYVCPTCGKSFAYPHVLSVHLRIHTGEKRFRCDHCSKGFTKKAYLKSHIEQHHSNLNFQVVLDDTTDSNQMVPMKSVAFEECIFTTELINDAANDITEEEDREVYGDDEYVPADDNKIIIQHNIKNDIEDQEDEDDDGDIHEIVEVHPDEYTIRVR